MSDVLLRRRRGPVEVLTLNRPERRNALSAELLGALEAAVANLREPAASGEVGAVVIIGTDPAWCAGLDLTELAEGGGALGRGEGLMAALGALDAPVIAAVNGPAVTGGLELALACDVRIASERARFADTHARVGIHPGWGMTANLPRLVGTSRAREMSFTGNYVGAEEAARWGLVSRVVPHAQLLDAAVALGEAMASVDPGIRRALRALYNTDEAHRQALARETAGFRAWRAGADTAAVVGGSKDAVIARGRAQQTP